MGPYKEILMNRLFPIFDAIRATNSIKEKLNILAKVKDTQYLEGVLRYCYDTITYTYGITPKTIRNTPDTSKDSEPLLGDMFTVLEALNCKDFTGLGALHYCKRFIKSNPALENLFLMILDRDLKLGLNARSLNKIYKGLVQKPKYNRCAVYSKSLGSKITYPAYVQLKCDGTYREAHVFDGKVTFRTRSGEEYKNPIMEEALRLYPNGFYFGEFTIGTATKPDVNRSIGNGLINSLNPPYEKIHFTMWDFLTDDEYNGLAQTAYQYRFMRLMQNHLLATNSTDLVHIVPTYEVDDLQNALETTKEWMDKGLEGAILKDKNMYFKDGTNNKQLKLKLKVDCEMRITGFTEGEGKRAGKVGAILFSNDAGTIKGSCSGFSDNEMNQFTNDPYYYIGKIMTVQFNDLSKSPENDYFALTHPRFIEIRMDKTETDSLSKVRDLVEMAKNLA